MGLFYCTAVLLYCCTTVLLYPKRSRQITADLDGFAVPRPAICVDALATLIDHKPLDDGSFHGIPSMDIMTQREGPRCP